MIVTPPCAVTIPDWNNTEIHRGDTKEPISMAGDPPLPNHIYLQYSTSDSHRDRESAVCIRSYAPQLTYSCDGVMYLGDIPRTRVTYILLAEGLYCMTLFFLHHRGMTPPSASCPHQRPLVTRPFVPRPRPFTFLPRLLHSPPPTLFLLAPPPRPRTPRPLPPSIRVHAGTLWVPRWRGRKPCCSQRWKETSGGGGQGTPPGALPVPHPTP